MQLGCLPYGILTVKGRVACITNEVISSRHDCVFQAYFCEFYSPIKLANCKAYTQYCPLHPDNTCLYKYCIPYRNLTACLHTQNVIVKLCVKDKPPNLKSLCVNQLHEKSSNSCKCNKYKVCVLITYC